MEGGFDGGSVVQSKTVEVLMAASNEQITFGQVLDAEMKAIHLRRQAAQFKAGIEDQETPVTDDADSNQKHPATVGLAISGGGIRSGCIGLGLLQSLYRNHVLRHVDYLSTVSGGGYVGAYLSSFLASFKGDGVDWTPGHPESREKPKLPFYSDLGAPQTGNVLQMSNRGEELKQPIKFLSRHLWGLITVNLFVFSGLIALGALAAYLFRLLDAPQTVLFLKQLGFMDDLGRALFPACVMFGLWLISISVAGILRQRRLKIPPFSSVMYFLFVLTLVMGCVTLLTTKNVETKYFETKWGVSREIGNGIRNVLSWLSQGFLVLFAVGMAPYLNVGAVIRSGTNPRNRLESWVFNLASSALLFGSPLMVFYILSREDISGWNSERPSPNTMARTSIVDWPEFWRTVGNEPRDPQALKGVNRNHLLLDKNATPSDVIWKWLGNTILPADYSPEGSSDTATAGSSDTTTASTEGAPNGGLRNPGSRRFVRTSEDAPGKSVVLEESIKNQDRALWFWQRWFQFAEYLVGTDDQFVRRWNDNGRLLQWKDAIITDFNDEVLSDPGFYLSFVEYDPKSETYKLISEGNERVATPPIPIPSNQKPNTNDKKTDKNTTVPNDAIARSLENFNLQLALKSALNIVLDVVSPVRTVSNAQSRGKNDKPIGHKFSSVSEWSGLAEQSWNESLTSNRFDPLKAEIPEAILQDIEERVKAINFLVHHCHKEHLAVLDLYEREIKASREWPDESIKNWRKEFREIQSYPSSKLSKCWRFFTAKVKHAIEEHETMERQSAFVSPEHEATFQSMKIVKRNQRKELEDAMDRVQRLNWQLLRAYFGKQLIHRQEEVFALVVIAHDQELRLQWFVRSGLLFVVLGLLFSVNPTMLHGFYRDQLAGLWLYRHTQYGTAVPLHQLRNCELGAPLPLMHGTLNLYGPRRDYEFDAVVRFTFSPLHVGAKRVGYCPSDQYMRGNCDLADVMAISGAAISPTATESILVRALLVLFNFRLGQWLHHPRRPPGDLAWPSPLRLLLSYLTVEPSQRDYLFVSDGGHTENTGIGALLQRRCRVIIACDSSQDGNYEFADLRKLLLEGENKYGVRFFLTDDADHKDRPVRFDDLVPDEKPKISADKTKLADEMPKPLEDKLKMSYEKAKLANKRFIVLRIEYPADGDTRRASLSPRPSTNEQPGTNKNPTADVKRPELDRTGYLIYIKPNLTGDESGHLLRFRTNQPTFPHDPTLDQFFEPNRFLAYRELGEHMGDDVCKQLFPDSKLRGVMDFPWLAKTWFPPDEPRSPRQDDKPVVPPDDAEFGLHSLGDMPFTNETAERVWQMLQHSYSGVRQVAYQYLCEYGGEADAALKSRAVSALLEAIEKERDPAVLIQACHALSWVGEEHPDAIEKLQSLSDDETQAQEVRTVCEILVKSMAQPQE